MKKTRRIALLIFFTLTLMLALPKGHAAPIDVKVASNQVELSMHLEIEENLTALPLMNVYATTSNNGNASAITGPITTGIQKLVPSASIESLQLHSVTINQSGIWHLQENYTIVVVGANSNTGSAISADLAFLSMKVLDTVAIANVELNDIGRAYFLSPVDRESQLGQSGAKIGWFIDGSKTLNGVIPRSTTDGFALLDFSWIPPIEFWDVTQDLLKQTTSWSFLQPGPQYNLTYGPLSPEQTLLKAYVAIYNPSVSLTVPANAFASGSTIRFDQPTAAEVAMPIISAVSLASLMVSLLIDRRFVGVISSRRRKR